MGRANRTWWWTLDIVAAAAAVALVAEGFATVHTVGVVRSLAAVMVVVTLGAMALAALARAEPARVAPLALMVSVAGLARAGDGRVAVAGFALSAFVPLVAFATTPHVDRLARGVLAAATLLAVVAWLTVRDPFRELRCEPFCDTNPFLVARHHGLVGAAELLLIGAVGFTIAWRPRWWLRVPRVQVVASAAAVLWAAHLLTRRRPIPNSRLDVIFDVLIIGVVTACAGLQCADARAKWDDRRHIQQFGETLAAATDLPTIERMLQRATRDPGLRIGLDTAGAEHASPPANTTSIVRHGRTVAVISHVPEARDRVAAAITAPVALAIETQLLLEQADRLVSELVTSRAQAAQSTDAARRKLERDLHDGAQQRLLVAGMTLADAADRAAGSDRDRYRSAADDLSLALNELRRIGRGDAAAVGELGLVDAVSALAGRAPVHVSTRVERCTDGNHDCWPSQPARAAYRLLVSIVAEAAQSDTEVDFSAVCLGGTNGRRVVARHGGSSYHPSASEDGAILRDRILAIGGQIEVSNDEGRTEAWLP